MMEEHDPRELAANANGDHRSNADDLGPGEERIIELREEQLVANKQLRDLGEVIVRTETDTVPARLEVEALREEVEVVHEPVGDAVAERQDPWEEDGVLVVPIYEEQLVVSKRLVLRERLRVRRVRTTERQLFEDSVRRERLVVEDPQQTRLVHEMYPTEDAYSGDSAQRSDDDSTTDDADGNFLTKLVTKALE
ncbi:MAG: DUF2382 domain-containing protein [Chloroflexi bacterium]|nr:DUF2382 domain-containing protein [Chloroflexota bacterium]MBV9895036.1 DUF2382 domain-containing protein [Chloroflexota bacterium]